MNHRRDRALEALADLIQEEASGDLGPRISMAVAEAVVAHLADHETAAAFGLGQATVIDAAHLERQRDWSLATFGPGARTQGVIDHIRKELLEVEADPDDLGEWVDVIILAHDGAWRSGHEPQEIIDAIKARQARNEARTWPDWRTADPDKAIEHVREIREGDPIPQTGFWVCPRCHEVRSASDAFIRGQKYCAWCVADLQGQSDETTLEELQP